VATVFLPGFSVLKNDYNCQSCISQTEDTGSATDFALTLLLLANAQLFYLLPSRILAAISSGTKKNA